MRSLILLTSLTVLLAVSVLGCANTVRGMGKDMDKAGDTMQNF